MSRVAAFRAPDASPAKPLASWYMPGMIDGFGDRLVMVDNDSSDALELLRFRAALRGTPGFEEALDRRVQQLRGLTHPAFPTVRGVEHLDGDGSLVLVSTSTPGQRLSQFLDERAPGRGLPPAFVMWIVSQTLEPISVLHAEGEDVAHTALTADRIILAPDGGVRVVEHVLGSALSHLECSPERLWQEFGILALCDDQGQPRLDGRGDIFQLGVVALSMLLARRITRFDVARLPSLVDEWSESSRSQLFHEPLRIWLERALQVGDSSFASAAEALSGLRELPLRPASKAVEFLQAGGAGPEATPETARRFIPQSTADTTTEEAQLAKRFLIEAVQASDFKPRNEPASAPDAAETGPVEIAKGAAVKPAVPPRSRALRLAIGIALVAAVVAEGAVITTLLMRQTRAGASQVAALPPEVALAPTGQASSQTPGDIADLTPTAQRPADNQGGTPRAAAADDAIAAALARAARNQRSGGVRLSTPIELKVLLGDRVLGSSADGPIVTSAGTHELEFINTALGFYARRPVTFRAGEITTMAIPVPPGRINVNATPWAEVWIDGRALGETPLANVEVPIGEHELVFRHPDLGERRQRVVVRADAVALASTTFR